MAQISNIKTEIASIKSTAKITKAMELVSTAKLKKISKIVHSIKEYSSEVYTIFNDIIKQTTDSQYLAKPGFQPKHTLWLVINSNIGLCGGYNININKLIMKQIKSNDDIYGIGQKSKSYFTSRQQNIISIEDISLAFSNDDSKRIALDVHNYFSNKKYDSIKIAYTKFVNNLQFEPVILSLLPITKQSQPEKTKDNDTFKLKALIEFDPDVKTILQEGIILYLNTIIYSAVVESQVSEQASRRLAMENATDNAEKLAKKLTTEYNRKRQDIITQEISEIISGFDAQNKNN